MKTDFNSWSFKWFGLWEEYGKGYEKYPSIKNFVNKERNLRYAKEKILKYLNEGFPFVSTSKASFPSPFTGEVGHGSVSFRTDGEWVWLDNIGEFIERNDLVIPEGLYERMEKNNFITQELSEEQIENVSQMPM